MLDKVITTDRVANTRNIRSLTALHLFLFSSRVLVFVLLASPLFLLSSCSSSRPVSAPPPVEDEEDYIYHRIKYSGETVAVISAWYTKSAKNWPEIVDANPKMVPSKLRLGDLVRIPKRLVRRFSSLPQDFVASFRSGVNKDSSSSQPAVADPSGDSSAAADNGWTTNPTAESNPMGEGKVVTEPQAEAPGAPARNDIGKGEPSAATAPSPVPVDPAAEAENQKIREQLMQELLQ